MLGYKKMAPLALMFSLWGASPAALAQACENTDSFLSVVDTDLKAAGADYWQMRAVSAKMRAFVQKNPCSYEGVLGKALEIAANAPDEMLRDEFQETALLLAIQKADAGDIAERLEAVIQAGPQSFVAFSNTVSYELRDEASLTQGKGLLAQALKPYIAHVTDLVYKSTLIDGYMKMVPLDEDKISYLVQIADNREESADIRHYVLLNLPLMVKAEGAAHETLLAFFSAHLQNPLSHTDYDLALDGARNLVLLGQQDMRGKALGVLKAEAVSGDFRRVDPAMRVFAEIFDRYVGTAERAAFMADSLKVADGFLGQIRLSDMSTKTQAYFEKTLGKAASLMVRDIKTSKTKEERVMYQSLRKQTDALLRTFKNQLTAPGPSPVPNP